jgi:hypothetical protein
VRVLMLREPEQQAVTLLSRQSWKTARNCEQKVNSRENLALAFHRNLLTFLENYI